MTADTFTCAACGGTFEKGWTDEEADAEMRATFGDLPMEDRVLVCDDCHGPVVAWAKAEGLIP